MSTTSSRRNSTASSNLPPSPSLTSQSSNGKSLSTTPPNSKTVMRSPKGSNSLTTGSPMKLPSSRRCSSARYKSSLTNSNGSISPSGSFRGRRTSVVEKPMSREEEIACYVKFRKNKVGSVSLANIFIDEAGSSSRESKRNNFLLHKYLDYQLSGLELPDLTFSL